MAEGAFSFSAQRALTAAFNTARELSHSCLCSEHILLGICSVREDRACKALETRGVTRDTLQRELIARGGRGRAGRYTTEISREAASVLERAAGIASSSAEGQITPSHILLAILCCEGCRAAQLLDELGADKQDIELCLTSPPRPEVKKVRSREPKLLLQYGVDMTQNAAAGKYDRLVGREEELERVTRVLCRRRKANPVLLGEAGVGKTAIAEGLAANIALGRVPPPLKNMRLISIDMASLVSGTKYRGEFEEKARGVIEEASSCGDIILFIDELHTVAGAGAAEGAIDAGNILKPALARGGLKILGATTPAEYRKYIAADSALERRFQPIDVPEPDRQATLAILRSASSACKRYYGVEAGEDTLTDIERMCRRFMPDRRFPDKAIDVLDEASAMAMTEGKRRIEDGHIKRVVAQMSGLSAPGSIDPAGLEQMLLSHVVGQPEAVRAAVSAVCSAIAFPGGRGRPKGVMLFCGPSGAGKTLLAKKLAEALFGGSEALIKFDMSEYREPQSVSRLIGSPPGYTGYGKGGLLTEAVRRKPFCLLLFDEIEKAHPEVQSLLLQLLEDGVLTDSEGRKADFKSSVVIMTSNAGGKGHSVGFGQKGDERARLSSAFSPELLSRIDKIISFSPLDKGSLVQVALLELGYFKDRLAEEGMTLVWDEECPRLLTLNAQDGRAVRAAVTKAVEEPLAFLCLSERKPQRVRLTAPDGELLLVDDSLSVL